MRTIVMHRYFILAVTALALALPTQLSAQSTAADRARLERERQQEQLDRDREREQQQREREQERREREQEREQQRRERERAGSLDTTVAFDARGTVNVSCPGGEVIVTGSDRSEIHVKARTESGAIRFSSSGGRATLEPAGGRGCSDGRFEISVPAGAKVMATSWSGSVSVRNVRGEVETHTQSANIDVRDVGRLDLETLSGEVTVQGVTGDARLSTVSGDIDLSRVRGDVEVETVSGDLTLRDVVARQVRTHSTSGDVEFAGQIADGGRYEFTTHSGSVRLQLPPDVGAQLSVATFNGGIESDFPITLRPGGHDIGRDQGKKLNFTLGQGSARIVVETFSGDITLSSAGRRR
ncbi:MAG TPA: DUF4097 family beta strand repeat-containing protein [Gemmatimonadaceae bacterium]